MKRQANRPVEVLQETTATEAAAILAPEFFQTRTSIQRAAHDLYNRGLNVFPIPRPFEVRARAKETGEDPNSKRSYALKPLFYSRLHLCGPECQRRYAETGRRCLPPGAEFDTLFEAANLALMTGRTSGNLLAADCDSQQAYKLVGQELQARFIPYWSYLTHRGGVYLFRVVEGEAANLAKGQCPIPDVECWGNCHYVVLPPSIHPSGMIYTWDNMDPRSLPPREGPPEVTIKQLEFLGFYLALSERKQPEFYGLPAWTIVLSERNRRILASTPDKGERNINLTPVIYDLAAAVDNGHVGYRDVDQLIMDFCRRCGYPISEAQGMLKSALKKSGLTSSKDYYDYTRPTQQAYEQALAFADSFDWQLCGRTQQADRAVFLACCERARLSNSNSFRASIREVGELAGLTKKTALAALKRLCKPGAKRPALLRLVFTDDARVQPNSYIFCYPDQENQHGNFTPLLLPCKYSGVKLPPSNMTLQDVFNRRPVARRVWEYLQGQPGPTAAAIARGAKLNRRSVSGALPWLVERGLVTFNRAEGLYIGEPKTPEELETLSAIMGTLGNADKRKREHQKEREQRANLIIYRARRSWAAKYHLGGRSEEPDQAGSNADTYKILEPF